jgi:hypothetical protein
MHMPGVNSTNIKSVSRSLSSISDDVLKSCIFVYFSFREFARLGVTNKAFLARARPALRKNKTLGVVVQNREIFEQFEAIKFEGCLKKLLQHNFAHLEFFDRKNYCEPGYVEITLTDSYAFEYSDPDSPNGTTLYRIAGDFHKMGRGKHDEINSLCRLLTANLQIGMCSKLVYPRILEYTKTELFDKSLKTSISILMNEGWLQLTVYLFSAWTTHTIWVCSDGKYISTFDPLELDKDFPVEVSSFLRSVGFLPPCLYGSKRRFDTLCLK